MCFSAKVKTPKVDTNTIKAPDPAPLTEAPSGVAFGETDTTDDGTSSEVSGLSSLKNSNDTTGDKKNTTSGTTGTVTNTDAKKTTGTKSSIRKSIFSKK